MRKKITPKYKCRYCGVIFDNEDKPRTSTLLEVDVLKRILTKEELDHFLRYSIHFAQDWAENPHMGVADLIGFIPTDKEAE